jgi:hypothetical protein
MKRKLAVLIATAAAALLAFVVAANFFPDWTRKVLNTVREAKTRIFEKKRPALELSKYALPPGTSVEEDQVSCPAKPQDMIVDIAVFGPPDESCSHNYEAVGNPLRGWVGCWPDGRDLKGVRIDALSRDGKDRLASTVTNSKGRFIFPNLRAGTYRLSVNSKGLERVDAVVTTNPRSQDTLCLVAAGATGGHIVDR